MWVVKKAGSAEWLLFIDDGSGIRPSWVKDVVDATHFTTEPSLDWLNERVEVQAFTSPLTSHA